MINGVETMSKVQIDSKNLYREQVGRKIEFTSYSTLVAVLEDDVLYITDTKYNVTTTKHVNMLKRTLDYNEIKSLTELV